MSMQSEETFQCPECGESTEVTIWQSINVDLDPEVRTLLFEEKINQFICKNCHYEAFINAALMYHDMTNEFIVQYYPPEALDDPEFVDMFEPGNPPLFKRAPENSGYFAYPHIVFNMNDLLNCIRFNEQLNGVDNDIP